MILTPLANASAIRRVRAIMEEAPWSNHDLLVGWILLLIGGALWIDPDVAKLLRSMAYLRERWGTDNIAALFFSVGAFGIGVTLWCVAPNFYVRLLSRMAGAFCLMLLAFSTILFSPWTPAAITYSMVGLWSVWGIIRTGPSGR